MPFNQTGESPGDYYVLFNVRSDGADVEFEMRHIGSAFPTEDQRDGAIQKIVDMMAGNPEIVYYGATKVHLTNYEVTPTPPPEE